MPASLTANANPVGVWGETASGTTTITWNTGSAARGQVFLTVTNGTTVTVNDAIFDGNPTTGDRNGSKALTVQFGSTYLLTLRNVANNATLASLIVTVEDLQAQLIAQAVAAMELLNKLNPPQAIYDLKVRAGIDTCHVKFKTVQPTIPMVTLTDPDGIQVAASFPLFGGLRTDHEMLLGEVTALPQATELTLKIVAAGHNFLNKPREAVVTKSLKTGSRHATIDFTEINVRTDGDTWPSGAGDFIFNFGAGDADNGARMGEPWPDFAQDISDDDPPVPIRKQINISLAPRNLWVEVVGTDDDSNIIWAPGIGLGRYPTFTGAGTGGTSVPEDDQAWVTGVFDIAGATNGTVIPMELSTGDFAVAFSVKGRITVNTTAGRSPLILNFSDWLKAGSISHVLGAAGMFAGTMSGQFLGRGADGAVYRRPRAAERDRWDHAAPMVAGAVTVVETGADRLALFALDADGAVRRADLVGDHPAREWRPLGGDRFTDSVVALPGARGIELLARDAEGAVFHRAVGLESESERGGDWQRIGDGVQGEIFALPLDAEAFAVFALGKRGEVLMKRHRDGRWQSKDWQVLEGATGVLLGAAARDGQGLALAVLDKTMKLTTLAARDERGLSPKAWTEHGDMQAWLVRPIEPRPAARAKKPAGRKVEDRKIRNRIAAE
jgi:hypothetical protein